jgi:hypothetical protein
VSVSDCRPRVSVTVGVAVLVALATTLQLTREVAVSAWDTIWAEDGSIFLTDALNRSFLETLAEPYGGYVHDLPRLVAAVAAAFPLANASFVFSVAASLTVSVIAAFVYFASAEVMESALLRLALAALVVLLPAAGSELLGNVTNVHFYFLFGCLWAFVWRSESSAALASRSAVAATAALGDPLAAIFLPIAFWSALRRRARKGLVVPLMFVIGLAIQLTAIAFSGEGPQRLTRFDKADVLPLFALRVTGSLLVGDRFIDNLWFALGKTFSYGALAVVSSLLVIGLVRLDRRRRILVVNFAGYAFVLFSSYLYGRGSAGMRPGSDAATWHLAGARYTLAPILFLVSALLICADGVRTRLASYVRFATAAFVAALLAANFSLTSERSLGPRWRPELAGARARCASMEKRPVRILVAPAPFGFYVRSTCDRIR